MKKETLREKLADLEHEQWAHWTKYLTRNFTEENVIRWEKQIETPYSKLSEKEKDSDREWADKVLKIFSEKVQNAQRRLKERRKVVRLGMIKVEAVEIKEFDKIFKEEFGEKLI